MEEASDASLYSLWSIQDTLLQYYRSMFLTAESLLLAVAASLSGTAKVPTLLLTLVGLVLLLVWVRVTGSRARDVTFSQELIKWHETGRKVRSPLTTFKEYQAARSNSNTHVVRFSDGSTETFEKHGVWPPRDCAFYEIWRWNARLQMERVLPFTYLLCWFGVVAYAHACAA